MSLEHALAAAGRGWHVFPIKERDKVPTVRWTEVATTDPKDITARLAGTGLNYGIACGPSGLVVVDEDEDGAAQALAQSLGYDQLPATFTVRTVKGSHRYYRANGTPVRNGVRKVPGIDVRAAGGYVVGPGSTHPTGGLYEVIDGRDVLPLPTWLAQALNDGPQAPGGALVAVDPARVADQPLPTTIPARGRRDAILSRVASMRARGATHEETLVLARYLHQHCEQPDGDPFTWDEAAAVVRDVFDRYDGPQDEDAYDTAAAFARDVDREAHTIRVREAARVKVAIERDADSPGFDAGTVTEILARPADPQHRVEGLIPWTASTLVVAARKTGKTTLLLNLARCLLDGEEFLGTFPTKPLTGRVGFLNYEVAGAQLARWAHEAGVDTDQMVQVNLRGRRNPLRHPGDRAALAKLLKDADVESLIVDPFGRAYGGKSQNDAAEVGAWLVDLDTFARSEVGALDLVLAVHAGWEGERTRGSSALEDWADVVLTMTRDRDERGRRYFAAEGRDVLVDEDRLEFNEATRTLSLAGVGSRRQAKAVQRAADIRQALVEIVAEHPGLNTREIGDKLRDAGHGHQRGDVGRAASAAVETGHIRAQHGPRNSVLYFPKVAVVPSSPDPSPREGLSSPDPSYRGRDYSTATQGTSSPERPVA